MPHQPLILPPGAHAAYLFDLDGTIADSMPLHYVAWSQAVAEFGGQFPEPLFYALGGLPVPRVVEVLNERFGTTMSPTQVAHRKESLYLEKIDQVQPIAAVLDIIHAAAGRIPFAVVSGSPRASIHRTLAALALTHLFPVIVGAEDYTHGKPHPEPFLTAAKLLAVEPTQCLVFEDAEAGIASATAAGMQSVRIPQPALSTASKF